MEYLKDTVFVFSGFSCDLIKQTILKQGGLVQRTLDESVDCLVVPSLPSRCSKVSKAKIFNIHIIELVDLKELLV